MRVIKDIKEMRELCDRHVEEKRTIKLVPTMGALHNGHVSLMEQATLDMTLDDFRPKPTSQPLLIVSIFVNPDQFNSSSDYQSYPSTLEADLRICQEHQVDFVFLPDKADIYPTEKEDRCSVCPPRDLANQLEGKSRPGHFEGVLTVVNKLFNIIKPNRAYFGEKDYQQLVLIERMTHDLNMDVIIRRVATVRESDLLPLSSRNVRLTKTERQLAPLIYQILIDAKKAIRNTEDSLAQSSQESQIPKLNEVVYASMLTTSMLNLSKEQSESFKVDYIEVRCSKDLSQIHFDSDLKVYDCGKNCVKSQVMRENSPILRTRLLISVIVGNVRLLDNIEVELNGRIREQ